MILVCDTGPLLHLAEANLISLLQKVGKIYIPEMVDKELRNLFAAWERIGPSYIHVEVLSQQELAEAELLYLSDILDQGEAEALVLAKRLCPDWFVTDDAEARIFAASFGMEAHGSLGLVLWCAAESHLDYKEATEALTALAKSSLWISQEVLSEAHKALNIMFEDS